jgi:uncharacterized protein DUF4430
MNANPLAAQGKGPQNSIRTAARLTAFPKATILHERVACLLSSVRYRFMSVIFPRRHWFLAFLAIIALATSAIAEPPKEPEGAKETVKLVIDYGDGAQKVFTSVPWTKETTVFTVLEAAARHPRGIKFVHQGKGETVLVTAIDDLKNEGRGRNWLYEVNGKLGDRSCAVMPLKAGDSVLWRFGKYQ